MKKLVLLTVVLAFVAAAAVSAAPRKTGTVKLAGQGMALELEFLGSQKFIVTSKGVSIPEGTYTPKSFTLMAKAKSGQIWKLECLKTLGSLSSFTVTAGETMVLDIGPPLKIAAMQYMSSMTPAGKVIPIGLEVKGKAGEVYADGIVVGSQRVPAPYFQILDENDKVLEQGKFEYG